MKKDLNKVETLMELAGMVNRMGWKMEVTSSEFIIENKDFMLCSMIFLSEIETLNEHAPFDVYLDEFFYEMDSKKQAMNLRRRNHSWSMIMEVLKEEYEEIILVKEKIYKWYLGE